MVKADFLKDVSLLSPAAYYTILTALWLYTLIWFSAWMALVRYSQQLHWALLLALAIVLFLSAPSIRDLIRPYAKYKDFWTSHNPQKTDHSTPP
jgi:thiol:disulfide interchange protein